ncbi:hypothetical protein AAG607_05990 [Citromicrobium bathyomarinum]|uniref:hypothetical protein n=1 Tax=Sphingomonadales TaxID=204457 RepID=UPI001A401070|nr:hypothetical protein [Citromicrobium sp.]
MNKNPNAPQTESSLRTWSAPQVIDLDDQRAVEGGSMNGPETAGPGFFSGS